MLTPQEEFFWKLKKEDVSPKNGWTNVSFQVTSSLGVEFSVFYKKMPNTGYGEWMYYYEVFYPKIKMEVFKGYESYNQRRIDNEKEWLETYKILSSNKEG